MRERNLYVTVLVLMIFFGIFICVESVCTEKEIHELQVRQDSIIQVIDSLDYEIWNRQAKMGLLDAIGYGVEYGKK